MDKDGNPTLLEVFKFFTGLGLHDESKPASEPQKILLIGAGHGRTGTSSLVKALARIGLKSYHMKEGVFDTPGHLDMWHEFYVHKSITIDDVIDRISKDGFNATADAPVNLYYMDFMNRFPDARVILTLRKNGGEGWAKSLYESVMQFHIVLKRVPFRWMPRFVKQNQFFSAMNHDFNVPVDPATGFPAREFLADEYDRWNEHVKAAVPEDKLLIFYAQDGWEPLCRFLSPLSQEIEVNCKQVVESGEPYPHINDTAAIQRIVFVLKTICLFCELFPALVVAYLVIRYTRSRASRKSKVKTS